MEEKIEKKLLKIHSRKYACNIVNINLKDNEKETITICNN